MIILLLTKFEEVTLQKKIEELNVENSFSKRERKKGLIHCFRREEKEKFKIWIQ